MTFFNIFSKKGIKEAEKPIIIADNREKNSLVISELISLNNKVNFEQLAIGDYIIGEIAIERKTISDLKNSIIDKRIFSQLNNLKQYPEHLLIIEEDNNIQSKINESAYKGFLLSAALKFNTSIIYSKSEKDTAKYLSILANKKQSKNEIPIRPNKKAMSKSEQMQFILEGFPSVGPVRAKKLLGEFKTLKKISNASIEELERAIGKNAEGIYNLFNQEFQP